MFYCFTRRKFNSCRADDSTVVPFMQSRRLHCGSIHAFGLWLCSICPAFGVWLRSTCLLFPLRMRHRFLYLWNLLITLASGYSTLYLLVRWALLAQINWTLALSFPTSTERTTFHLLSGCGTSNSLDPDTDPPKRTRSSFATISSLVAHPIVCSYGKFPYRLVAAVSKYVACSSLKCTFCLRT